MRKKPEPVDVHSNTHTHTQCVGEKMRCHPLGGGTDETQPQADASGAGLMQRCRHNQVVGVKGHVR